MEHGYIYIITDGENYKVGVSINDPLIRLKQLQTGHPKILKLINKFKVPRKMIFRLEKEAHRLIQTQYQKRGEWFKNCNAWHINIMVDQICEKHLISD